MGGTDAAKDGGDGWKGKGNGKGKDGGAGSWTTPTGGWDEWTSWEGKDGWARGKDGVWYKDGEAFGGANGKGGDKEKEKEEKEKERERYLESLSPEEAARLRRWPALDAYRADKVL